MRTNNKKKSFGSRKRAFFSKKPGKGFLTKLRYNFSGRTQTYGPNITTINITKELNEDMTETNFKFAELIQTISSTPEFYKYENDFLYTKILRVAVTVYPNDELNNKPTYLNLNWINTSITEVDMQYGDKAKIVYNDSKKTKTFMFRPPDVITYNNFNPRKFNIISNLKNSRLYLYIKQEGSNLRGRIDIRMMFRGPRATEPPSQLKFKNAETIKDFLDSSISSIKSSESKNLKNEKQQRMNNYEFLLKYLKKTKNKEKAGEIKKTKNYLRLKDYKKEKINKLINNIQDKKKFDKMMSEFLFEIRDKKRRKSEEKPRKNKFKIASDDNKARTEAKSSGVRVMTNNHLEEDKNFKTVQNDKKTNENAVQEMQIKWLKDEIRKKNMNKEAVKEMISAFIEDYGKEFMINNFSGTDMSIMQSIIREDEEFSDEEEEEEDEK